MASIKELQNYMLAVSTAPNPAEAAYNRAKQRYAGSADAITQLRTRAAGQPQPVQRWLNEIADNSWSLILQSSMQYVNERWQQDVHSAYQQTLADRFPLVNSSSDAALQDFNAFFKPGGVEAQFVSELLKPFLDTRKWELIELEGRNLGVNQESINHLKQAEKIRKAFFRENSSAATVSFELQPSTMDAQVSQFELDLGDGKSPFRYSHGPKIAKSSTWKGNTGEDVRIMFKDLNDTKHEKSYPGEWAFFRLLRQSRVRKSSRANSYTVVFTTGRRSATYYLKARSSINPFSSNVLNYSCPESL